jgi:hypothetical protein
MNLTKEENDFIKQSINNSTGETEILDIYNDLIKVYPDLINRNKKELIKYIQITAIFELRKQINK